MNPSISFQMMNIEVPQFNILLDISTITQLNRDSAAYANMQPATPDRLVKAVSTRVIFLPSFLLADLSNIGSIEISDLYFQAVQSINSWANSFNTEDTTEALKLACITQCAPILQWLWACHHQGIAATTFHPSVGPAEAEYKSFMQSTTSICHFVI